MTSSEQSTQRGAELSELVYSGLVSAARREAAQTAPAAPRYSLADALAHTAARRLWFAGERTCAWCDQAIRALADAEELGLRLVHHDCAAEFDAWATEDEAAAREREAAPRARAAADAVLEGFPDVSDEDY